MPKIKEFSFFLKDAKAITPTLIYFRMPLPGDKPLKRSLGKLIHPDNWDFQEQRPMANRDKEIRDIDKLIDKISETIPVVKNECRRDNRVITRADVNAALDIILQTKQKGFEPGRDMIKDCERVIELMKEGKVLTPGRNKKKYKPATIKNFEKSVRKIEAFYKQKKLPSQFSAVTLDTYTEFLTWCHEQKQSNNSIGVFIKCWKRLADVAKGKGWHSNVVFGHEDFAILKEETPDIFLSEDKIAAIYRQPTAFKYHGIARDWFVLDCYLGLRISDLGQVSEKDFTGKYFQMVNVKTGATVVIPIHPSVKAIIKKWKGLPPPISDQRFNEYIKIVARAAKLKEKFIYKITKGGELVSETLEEWQMVSSHTCRRSFITNLLKVKKPHPIPHAIIMRLVGIKRYETLQRYFKLTESEAAAEVAEHDYFKDV